MCVLGPTVENNIDAILVLPIAVFCVQLPTLGRCRGIHITAYRIVMASGCV